MEESSSFQDITKTLQLWSEIKQSHAALVKQQAESQEKIFMLRNMLKMAQEGEKNQALLRNQSELVVIKQNSIIAGLVKVKEENKSIKEQLSVVKENLERKIQEKEDQRVKWIKEMEAAEYKFKETLIEQAETMNSDFEQEKRKWMDMKKSMEQDMTLLKQCMETQLNEKNLVMEVTVKEYEDQLNMLKQTLDDMKQKKMNLEERNKAKIDVYEKKLKEQEKHYISTLEKVTREVSAGSQTPDAQTSSKVVKKVHFQKPYITSYADLNSNNNEGKPQNQQRSYYPPINVVYGNQGSSNLTGSTYKSRLGLSEHKPATSTESSVKEYPISKRRRLFDPDVKEFL